MPGTTTVIEVDQGSLSSRLVASLAGVRPSRLDSWHRRSIIRARVYAVDPPARRWYTWRQYCQARAAAKLLERGVPARSLRAELAALDATVDNWPALALREHQRCRIEPCSAGPASHAIAWNGGGRSTITFAYCDAGAEEETSRRFQVISELQAEGPLAGLAHCSQWIDMRPAVQAGWPTIFGTRVTTGTIAGYAETGMSAAEIADTLWLDLILVEKALAFHAELGIPSF